MRIGLIGATGMVGGAFLQVLDDRKFPVDLLKPFASEASLGKEIAFRGKKYPVQTLSEASVKDLDLVFIASGEDVSETWSPTLTNMGITVVDNSSAFRMAPNIPLVCPEVNGSLITKEHKLYANPNCSTIQLVVLLKGLSLAAKLEEVVVASYQAVSGAGREALAELKSQSQGASLEPRTFPKKIAFNCLPQIGGFDEAGFTSEENKIMCETKKILHQDDLHVSAQCVRVPVENCHAESVWVTFSKEVSEDEVLHAIRSQEGLFLNPNDYDTQIDISGRDGVYVSRVRRDLDNPKKWLFWLVADNIRKGAATNAIQIAEKLI